MIIDKNTDYHFMQPRSSLEIAARQSRTLGHQWDLTIGCFDNDDEMATGSDRRGTKPIKRMALEAVALIGSPRATFHLGPGPKAAPKQRPEI